MKIGIITFWTSSHNYGQILQCYALQRFLRDMGHDPFHIKYVDSVSIKDRFSKYAKAVFMGYLFPVIHQLVENRKNSLLFAKQQTTEMDLHPRGFDEFRRKYLSFTTQEYFYRDLKKNPPKADCLIAGSDQIWTYPNHAYMLDFGDPKIKRIAYAPSMGGKKMENVWLRAEFRQLLMKLDVVTCREEDGIKVCREIGRMDAELVPDPVLLLSALHYREIARSPQENEPYVFIYLLGNPIGLDVQELFSWAERKQLKIVYVTAQGRNDTYIKSYPNIDEWIGLIDKARYVFTNSFHGMVMSIILNKDFLVFPLIGQFAGMNSRLTTTLCQLGLDSRIYKDSLDVVADRIDYLTANLLLEKVRYNVKQKFETWLR